VIRELEADEIQMLSQGRDVSLELHLQIDVFYVFAKIVLDDVGKAIESFFGPERELPISRTHRQMKKNLVNYIERKGLRDPKVILRLPKRQNIESRTIATTRSSTCKTSASRRERRGAARSNWHGSEQGCSSQKDTDDDPPDSDAPPVLLNFIEQYVGEVLRCIEETERG
jgi:hypothetical protein